MSPLVITLVLGAAVAHASWNALLKSGADRFWTMAAISVVTGLVCVPLLFFVPLPPAEAWPYIIASVLIHIGYNLLLVRMYGAGDFTQTYPIARGSSPLLVALGALLVTGETLDAPRMLGVVLVSGGIMAIAFEGKRFSIESVPTALATGAAIALYTVVDGIGARLCETSLSYSAWMFVLWSPVIAAIYVFKRGAASIPRPRGEVIGALGGGLIAGAGYTAVIWAMTMAPMGPVSAMRETSVVFAALIGRFVLRERLSRGRAAACVVIAGGAALLA
jgi:drug/metabolite transporter (DMT)-like permease